MTGSVAPYAKVQYLDQNGTPYAFGKVFTYAAGTSTPLATYTDATLSVANTNPVVLDAAGRADIWIGTAAYKFVLQDTFNDIIWTVDNLNANGPTNASNLTYNQGGVGAVNQTVQNRLQRLVFVEDYGAKGDGTTDDTTAIQTCINNNPNTRIIFSTKYLISAPLTISTGGMTLTGLDGSFFPSIISNALGSDIIQINCGTNTLSGNCISNLFLDSTAPKTGGYGINITAVHGGSCFWTEIENINMSPRMFGGINVQSCFYLTINDITVQAIGAGARGFSFAGVDATSQVESVYGRNLKVAAGTSNGSTYGMFIDNFCQGFYLSQVSLETNGIDTDLFFNNTSGIHANAPFNMWFDQLICDSPKNNGITINDCTTLRFGNPWTTSAGNSGVFITAGIDIEFQGNSAINNGRDGYTIHGGSQIRILGGVCDQNSALASNTYSGVNISAGVSDFTIRDVDFFRQGSSAHHFADILVNGGASDRYVITGNRCRGFVTSAISDGGTGTNKWVTQNDNYNPRGFSVTQPAVPASGTTVLNQTGTDCMVYLVGGTLSNIAVAGVGGSTFTGLTTTPASVMVPAGGNITVFYSAAPTWKWFGS